MQHKYLFTCLIIIFGAIHVNGQTASNLETKYGPPIRSFEVRPGIFMRVKYAVDGQVCEMNIERHQVSDLKVNLNTTIEPELIEQLIDELAPSSERGARTDKSYRGKYWLESVISGDLIITSRNYEKATIRIIGSLSEGSKVLIIKRKNEGCN